jgi:hypothetical protein
MRGPLAAVTDRDTYRGLLFLSTALPLGTLWLAASTAGWVLAVTLAITPLGVLVVIGLGVLADGAPAPRGADLPDPPPGRAGREPDRAS